jgi:hypothetical protein
LMLIGSFFTNTDNIRTKFEDYLVISGLQPKSNYT